ncbi:MAG: acyl-homoserine-lactone synthase, partial [Halofilum sp. (in: g-proteobacteria)]
MDTIALDRGFGQRADPYSLHNMYRLRHEVFHERLGWEVTSAQGLEQDEYDALQPVYLITRGPQREVTGCLRLLPTSGPYMLRDTFPQLLAGETPPADARIWDISRMAVAKPVGRDGVRGEVTVVIARAPDEAPVQVGQDDLVERVRSLVATGLPKKAAI